MRKLIVLLPVLFLLPFNGSATVWTIVNSGFTFSPAEITIDFGDSVNFTIGGAHQVREVSQTDWDLNSNTALAGGFQTAFGGGMLLPADLPVGTHYYVCVPHASMGMKGKIIVNPSPLNLEENKPELNFSLSPNPSSGNFQLTVDPKLNASKIEVYNLLGELVYQTAVVNAKTMLDLSGAERGVYFVKLYAGQAVLTKKLILS